MRGILDDIISSHANTVFLNDFENILKKLFENIVFRNIKNIKGKGNGKLSIYSKLISTQNRNKIEIRQYLSFFDFQEVFFIIASIKNRCQQITNQIELNWIFKYLNSILLQVINLPICVYKLFSLQIGVVSY